MNRIHKSLTILLISLALCGIQVVQASPLHDHVSHIAGCSLCHFDGAHAIQAVTPDHSRISDSLPGILPETTSALLTPAYPAFHGRAPPEFSL